MDYIYMQCHHPPSHTEQDIIIQLLVAQ